MSRGASLFSASVVRNIEEAHKLAQSRLGLSGITKTDFMLALQHGAPKGSKWYDLASCKYIKLENRSLYVYEYPEWVRVRRCTTQEVKDNPVRYWRLF